MSNQSVSDGLYLEDFVLVRQSVKLSEVSIDRKVELLLVYSSYLEDFVLVRQSVEGAVESVEHLRNLQWV